MGPKSPRLGDVVCEQNGDGVFTGRESHRSHHAMTFFPLIAAIDAVIGTICCVANSSIAQADQRWTFHDSGGFRSYGD